MHHYITQLNINKGAVGNPVELILIGIGIGGFFDFLPRAVLIAGTIGSAVGTYQHINVRFNTPRWWRFLFNTTEHRGDLRRSLCRRTDPRRSAGQGARQKEPAGLIVRLPIHEPTGPLKFKKDANPEDSNVPVESEKRARKLVKDSDRIIGNQPQQRVPQRLA